MKTYPIILIMIFLLPLGIAAQRGTPDMRPVLAPGKTWYVVYTLVSPQEFAYTEIETLKEETELDGKKYFTVYVTNRYGEEKKKGYLREEKGKIYGRYIVEQTSGEAGQVTAEYLMYDFSLRQGETCEQRNPFHGAAFDEQIKCDFTAIEVDTVEIQGKPCKRIRLESLQSRCETWIEGIGSLNGLLEAGDISGGTRKSLSCCYDENELLYHNEKYKDCIYTGVDVLMAGKRVTVEIRNGKVQFIPSAAQGNNTCLHIYNAQGTETGVYLLDKGILTLENLPEGVYLYRLNGANAKAETGKFIIGN